MSDILARVALAIDLLSVLWNMILSFMWFLSLIWVLVGLMWGIVGLVAVVQGAVCVYGLVKGYAPATIAAPVIGLVVSIFNSTSAASASRSSCCAS